MAKDIFRFKQFSVSHARSAMKVGTDGVLLGAWCSVGGCRRVLDVGTGCGLIALMVAQRNDAVRVDAIDVDAGAVADARSNFAASPWPERLNALETDFNAFEPDGPYDLIVSNPPFFSDSLLPPDAQRAVARHGGLLTYDQLVGKAAAMLTPRGMLALVTPSQARSRVLECASFARLTLLRMTSVQTAAGVDAKRILWEFGREPGPTATSVLAIRDASGGYSADYRRLCSGFYLEL